MGRSPCCEKEEVKKGPWTPEEDQILVSYVLKYGHSNWRALPKLAGLLRCGKSCRLRWVNYLKPDIKRGNFSSDEEEAIIKLHEIFGNRWSAIAARLPGRTDNEIKNVWHTHLKKRLGNYHPNQDNKPKKKTKMNKSENNIVTSNNYVQVNSPQQSTTTTTTTTSTITVTTTTEASSFADDSSMHTSPFPEIDESFWTENLSIDDFEIMSMVEDFEQNGSEECVVGVDDGMDQFWYNVFIQAGGPQELPEF